jgi:competence protein ComEC
MTPRSLSHRAPLLGLVVAWAAGSLAVHVGLVAWPAAVFAIVAVAGLGVAWAGRSFGRGVVWWATGLFVALAAVGALRTGEERRRLEAWDALALPPREARLTLRIERVFASPAEEPRAGGLAEVVDAEPHLRDLVGQRVQFSVEWPRASARAWRGAEFTALGLLRPVERRPEEASFDRFLADAGVNFSFGRARLRGEPKEAGAWGRFCAAAGDRLEAILRTGLAGQERLADLHVAMMLGRQQELSEEQQELFVRSGTMHLFAISGLHIAGIAVALNTLLAVARLPAGARFAAGTVLLWVFVEVTGGTPSAVRAFWMVTCLLGARLWRAPGNSIAALAVSALGVLVVAPHQIFSASFQMSYGIVAALLLYGVPLQEKWLAGWTPWAHLPRADRGWVRELVEAVGRGLIGAVALGLAATLVSTPATLGFFQLMTPGGFFVNLLLIPLSTLVLFAGVAAIVVGGVGLAPLASVFNHAAALLLAGMEAAVAGATQVPGAAWPARFAWPGLATATGAGLLILLAVGYVRGWRRREGGFWVPYVVLGLVLVLGVRGVTPGP